MNDAPRDQPLATYGRARDTAVHALTDLHELLASTARWHGAGADVAELAATIARVRDGRFVLAVVGEFSSGKSFLLNALLGKVEYAERAGAQRIVGLLATDINPSTATITELSYAPDEIATAFYPDGREERIPMGRLARFVAVAQEAKLHDATGDESGSPNLVRIGIDSAFLRNGFVVADTPGLASINPAHRRATLAYLPGADAVLYLVDTQQPFTDGDAAFLGIVRRYIESIFIVQTKIDLWRMRDGEREIWQSASARIVAQAAIHAPDVPVFPLSARDYAQGLIERDEALVAQSRFPQFLAALDASLVATTGRARLRRAAAAARRLATRAADSLARDVAALELDEPALHAMRDGVEPALIAADSGAAIGARRLRDAGASLHGAIVANGVDLRAGLRRTLARAFDTADIARLRDRAKLHIIIDTTLAAAIGRFAGDVADGVAGRLRTEAKAAVGGLVDAARIADPAGDLAPILDAIVAERLPVTQDAALAFGADPSSGAWSADLETGVRSTIVLGALGGPAVGLVAAIAQRFAAAPYGTYMKRELLADLGSTLFADFDADIADFALAIAERVERIAARLAERVADLAARVRAEAAAPVERAIAAHAAGTPIAVLADDARSAAERAVALATRIETISETFASAARVARGELADPAIAVDPLTAARLAAPATEARFNPQTYEHGLVPARWRVAVLGALRRGKSSFINATAGERVLGDEGSSVEMRFPVHVRFGPASKAYALGDDAAWDPIAWESALDAATRTPVLIETPWHLPRQLVLVHTPAFDSGQPDAEQIAFAVAASASELIALFSRQLSDRELDVYGRMAALGKPVTFAHTLADLEAPIERRNVVALADRYLRERAIVPERIFTISTNDYRTARAAGQTPAAWNELGALISTLTAHAEEHMARLERAQRDRAEIERLSRTAKPDDRPAAPPRPSFLERIFGRH